MYVPSRFSLTGLISVILGRGLLPVGIGLLLHIHLLTQTQRIFDTMLADGMPKSNALYQNY